jgi:hypothetical protein
LDAASLLSLQEALPEWQIEVVNGATAASLSHDWNPGKVGLLIVQARAKAAETLGLCRFLESRCASSTHSRPEVAETLGLHRSQQDQARRADAPLLVLVPPGQETLAGAALEAGARSCLVLPIHAKEVAGVLANAQAGNQPGRHTLGLDRAQDADPWQEEGGEA